MNRKIATPFASKLGAVTLIAFLATPAAAQWRYVVVNGKQLHPLQIEQLERLYCSPIANGRYWYDASTGVWGYEGDPRPQGRFVYRCSWTTGANGQRRSLSGRGLLYSTQEILRGRP
jgi:hypothetical protein